MLKIVVLASGGGTNLQAIIDRIADGTLQDVQISAVISNNEKAYALERARQNNIPVRCISPKDFSDREAFDEVLLSAIAGMNADLIILAGYLVTISEMLVKAYPNRIINIHPSLIPAFSGKGYYGLKVHQGVLARGVKITGATVHFVDEGTDTGPIIAQKAVIVKADDTPETLQRRVMEEAEWILLPQVIGAIAADRVVVDDKVVRIIDMKDRDKGPKIRRDES